MPYLGVWIDEGGYGGYGMGCAAPEPCTGAFDSLALARQFGKISEIPPKGTASWWLKIHLQKGGEK